VEAHALQQARHRSLSELPPERQTLRANVEALMMEFKAHCRMGKLRTRGHAAAAQYGALRAIAINFGRIHRHLRKNAGPSAGSRGFLHLWSWIRPDWTAPPNVPSRLLESLPGFSRLGGGDLANMAAAR
jgi:hypothetical protein